MITTTQTMHLRLNSYIETYACIYIYIYICIYDNILELSSQIMSCRVDIVPVIVVADLVIIIFIPTIIITNVHSFTTINYIAWFCILSCFVTCVCYMLCLILGLFYVVMCNAWCH
jgi:hypothetical protein